MSEPRIFIIGHSGRGSSFALTNLAEVITIIQAEEEKWEQMEEDMLCDFHPEDLPEPSSDELYDILRGAFNGKEEAPTVDIDIEALRKAAVESATTEKIRDTPTEKFGFDDAVVAGPKKEMPALHKVALDALQSIVKDRSASAHDRMIAAQTLLVSVPDTAEDEETESGIYAEREQLFKKVLEQEDIITYQKNLLDSRTCQIKELHLERQALKAEILRLHTLLDSREKGFQNTIAKQRKLLVDRGKRVNELRIANNYMEKQLRAAGIHDVSKENAMIESTITGAPFKEKFPRLMINKDGDKVVLFTSAKQGTVVGGCSKCHPVGHQAHDWAENSFKDFKGSITLQNA